MATLLVQQAPFRKSCTPPPPAAAAGLTLDASKFNAAPVPNKHIPFCSPGPAPSQARTPVTPPSSPESDSASSPISYVLHPADAFPQLAQDPPIYSIDAATLHAALDRAATTPLPDAKQVFPWLHGLHPENQVQQAYFVARRRNARRVPKCLRGITLVKAGGDLSHAKLKGAVAPCEVLAPAAVRDSSFYDIDPKEGFSVRNFHIQVAKLAICSDVVVYKDDGMGEEELRLTAQKFARAQRSQREKGPVGGGQLGVFNTFVLTDSFAELETRYHGLVAIASDGQLTGNVMDFFLQERREMYEMSRAAEICPNVWLGPTPDSSLMSATGKCDEDVPKFDILIEASDLARPPDDQILHQVAKRSATCQQTVEFPASGSMLPPTWSHTEVDALLGMCHWIYNLANAVTTPETDDCVMDSDPESESPSSLPFGIIDAGGSHGASASPASASPTHTPDADGDIPMQIHPPSTTPAARRPRRILIHCSDGYTESSLLAVAYFMFTERLPVHAAWVRLHRERKRNFFAYASDVALLKALQPRLLAQSPKGRETALAPGAQPGGSPTSSADSSTYSSGCSSPDLAILTPPSPSPLQRDPRLCGSGAGGPAPAWLRRMDGSLPSRVLPYLYLGNLGHANNPGLLRELGITRVLSVGERVGWPRDRVEAWGKGSLLFVDRVQDNGVDSLMDEFDRCLAFIEQGKRDGTATLVHCRVGVSRSATICIAEVMASLGLSLPKAYCFVRARRLNVIIQPHLRFIYELLQWEAVQQARWGKPLRRELEWAAIAREIAAINKPYTKQ